MAYKAGIGVTTPPRYGATIPCGDAERIIATLAKYHLDLLSEAGWSAAGQYIADCITCSDLSALCHYDPDVLDLCALDVYHIRQSLAYYQKRIDVDIGVDREGAAYAKFCESERRCALVNSRFLAWSAGRFRFDPLVERVLHAAQRKIADVLGPAPSIYEIPVRFGPGASTQVQKRDACLAWKLRRVPTCSANAADGVEELLASLYPYAPLGKEIDVEIHDAVLSFVPKNAKTDRAICTEPSLNGLFQLGLGDLMAQLLRKVGVDTRDQSKNQRAALYGSISGELATLDLSSASDSVSLGLCFHLLPDDWMDLLLRFRSDAMVYKGKRHVLEKISSMGNGFTFPLECLIFWAIAQSCTDLNHNPRQSKAIVYGDDIIVPTASVSDLRHCLTELGFVLNDSKSFWDGAFRESCGCDYLRGIDVRPIFVKGDEVNNLTVALTTDDLFRIHNGYMKRGDFCAAALVLSAIHPQIRLRGPAGYGDGYLHSTCWVPTLYRPRYKGEDKQYSGYTFSAWTYSVNSFRKDLRERVFRRVDGKYRYNSDAFFHVMRIATYVAYRSAVTRSKLVSEPWPHATPAVLRRQAMDWVFPTSCDGMAPWVTPGVGEVTRTKIYIFEPASA